MPVEIPEYNAAQRCYHQDHEPADTGLAGQHSAADPPYRRGRVVPDQYSRFAEEQVRPLVAGMDRDAKMDPMLIRQFFELGLMGIEVSEAYGGAAGTFFMCVLAVEELSRVDAAAAVVVDVQNTLVNNAFIRWGTEDQLRRFLPRLSRDTVGAYALSEAGSGSDAFALATRAAGTRRADLS